MQKTVCVSLPSSLLQAENLQNLLSQHFVKTENGGAEILKCHLGLAETSVFLTVKVSIEGLTKLMTASHEIEGQLVTVQEVVEERHYTLLFTRKPSDSELQGLQSRLEKIGIHRVKQVTSCDEPTKKKGERDRHWRQEGVPPGGELMIISSFGDDIDPSVEYTSKPVENLPHTNFDNKAIERQLPMSLVHQELDLLLDRIKGVKTVSLSYVCMDIPGAQLSREYYLERIKLFMEESTKPSAVIWYTGHGEKGTGNWVFKDGVIAFRDIFRLYLDHFKGKALTLVCDCCYSGKWVMDCAELLDETSLPSCGHHLRENGILLKVFCACREDQLAKMNSFCQEGIFTENDKEFLFYNLPKQLSADQNSTGRSFLDIRCSRRAGETCEIEPDNTWADFFRGSLVYLVRGKDRDRPAWHYVLVEKEKEAKFKEKVALGNVDVAKFGRVLHSGWGKDPPDDIRKKIKLKFNTIEPE